MVSRCPGWSFLLRVFWEFVCETFCKLKVSNRKALNEERSNWKAWKIIEMESEREKSNQKIMNEKRSTESHGEWKRYKKIFQWKKVESENLKS